MPEVTPQSPIDDRIKASHTIVTLMVTINDLLTRGQPYQIADGLADANKKLSTVKWHFDAMANDQKY